MTGAAVTVLKGLACSWQVLELAAPLHLRKLGVEAHHAAAARGGAQPLPLHERVIQLGLLKHLLSPEPRSLCTVALALLLQRLVR